MVKSSLILLRVVLNDTLLVSDLVAVALDTLLSIRQLLIQVHDLVFLLCNLSIQLSKTGFKLALSTLFLLLFLLELGVQLLGDFLQFALVLLLQGGKLLLE